MSGLEEIKLLLHLIILELAFVVAGIGIFIAQM